MTITQPEDKTLTRERIEAILIALNHHFVGDERELFHATDLALSLNKMPNLHGRFTLSEKGEIVFVAH